MIIGEILKQIKNHGTKVLLTSNAHPDDLYKDGLQRQKFIHSIKIFLENIGIHRLEGDIDYRSRNIIQLDSKNDIKIYSDEDISILVKENFGLDKLNLNKIAKTDEVDFVEKIHRVYKAIKKVSSDSSLKNKNTIGFVGQLASSPFLDLTMHL